MKEGSGRKKSDEDVGGENLKLEVGIGLGRSVLEEDVGGGSWTRMWRRKLGEGGGTWEMAREEVLQGAS